MAIIITMIIWLKTMVGILSLLLSHNDMINGEYDCSDMVNMVKIPSSNKHLYICLHGIYIYVCIIIIVLMITMVDNTSSC